MAERVDVCIVGSGFGGSIAAWRLAELYRAAGADPRNILVLERGRRFKHTDFKQSMDIGHLSYVYNLIQSTQGTGAQIVVANGVGGGSNLYLAASCARPRETFERRDHRPDDGPERRMWPKADLAARPSTRYYRAGRAALRVERPTLGPGLEVGRPVGGDAERRRPHLRPRPAARSTSSAASNASGATPAASSARRTPCITNYLGAAEDAGRRDAARARGPAASRRSTADGYRYVVTASVLD